MPRPVSIRMRTGGPLAAARRHRGRCTAFGGAVPAQAFLAAFFFAAFLGAAFFFAAFLAMGAIPLCSLGANRSAA